jgi:TRAP-type transport system small permease protein
MLPDEVQKVSIKNAIRLFQRLNKTVDWLLCQLVWLIFACMVLQLAVLVFGRYFFGISPVWVVELSQYSFVWLTGLGICVAYRRGAHISLEYLWDMAPARIAKLLKWIVHVSVICMGWFMIDGGIVLIQVFGGEQSSGMGIAMTWVYASLVVSGALLCTFVVEVALIDLGLIPPVHARTKASGDARPG